MSEKIRIIDIANEAGVSPGTVDRVLHNRGNVSAKAKAKVMAALEQLDYSPNILASALANRKQRKIAALIPRGDNDPFWSQPKEGMLTALQTIKDFGVTLEFFHFEDNDTKDFTRQVNAIIEGDFSAVVLAPIFRQESIHFMENLDNLGIPFVQINTYLENDREHHLCYIGQDSYHSGRLAGKLLAFGVNSGEKVAITHLEESVYDSQHLIDKENGFKDYFANHSSLNIDVVTDQFLDPHDEKGLSEFYDNLLSNHPEIKGLFVTTSRAFHAVRALEKIGKTDLKIVGFDLIEENLKLLHEEKIDFLINQNPVQQGYLALTNIFNYIIRKQQAQPIQYLPLDIVMKENVSYYTSAEFKSFPVLM